MSNTIKHTFFFPYPKEMVWEYLTKSELLEQWLMKNDFQPVIGRDFQFKTNPIPSLNFDGICYCKVLELIPFKKLSYSWKGGPRAGVITLDTLVVWNLLSTDTGTELHLEHSGFENENLSFYNGMIDGWVKNAQKITNHLKTAQHGTTKD